MYGQGDPGLLCQWHLARAGDGVRADRAAFRAK